MNILVPFSVFLVFNVFIIGVTLTHGQSRENIALNCGVAGTKTSYGNRSWDGDVNSKFFLSSDGENKASVALATLDPLTGPNSVPYGTARLSRAEIRYRIPVTPGQKFVRLHFFASEYEGFDRSNAFFSVKAANYTLLSNFSSSLVADNSSRNDIVREYSINVGEEDASLDMDITLTPASSIPESYALINGIEVVSIPADLFYSKDYGENGIPYLGMSTLYQWSNDTAVETVHRVNIGGPGVDSTNDTGFFRSWESVDTEVTYLEMVGPSALPELDASINLRFDAKYPDYIAPALVYRTARNLGPDKAANLKYNLTWHFPVDSGFNYRVRLHFCEIIEEISRGGDRVFRIHIDEYVVENYADVLAMCGAQHTPCFRDYVVRVVKPGGGKASLKIAIQARADEGSTRFTDAMVNGVEIFKLSDFKRTLAGLNPDPIPASLPGVTEAGKDEKMRTRSTAELAN